MNHIVKIAPTLGRFLVVGLGGTLVNLSVLWLMVNAGLPHLLAALVATEVSILNNFVWNDLWTFKLIDQSPRPFLARFGRFQLVTSFTAMLTLGLFLLFTNSLHLNYLVAQFIAIAIATVVNFVVNSRLTWQVFGQSEPPLPSLPLTLGDFSTSEEVEKC